MRFIVDAKIGKEEMGVFIHVVFVSRYARSAAGSRETSHMTMFL